jgi:hypothetical protein
MCFFCLSRVVVVFDKKDDMRKKGWGVQIVLVCLNLCAKHTRGGARSWEERCP